MEKAELIIAALQQRIGEMTANYETTIALLRAELTLISNSQEEKQNAIEEYTQELQNKLDL
ncbi:MAG: hypothetical protein RLZZ196_77 [Bacteroidota bacterium]|jgi:uncharacterized protein YlzI (FlbEa/FlbD family)